jgi:hypothetical protein
MVTHSIKLVKNEERVSLFYWHCVNVPGLLKALKSVNTDCARNIIAP